MAKRTTTSKTGRKPRFPAKVKRSPERRPLQNKPARGRSIAVSESTIKSHLQEKIDALGSFSVTTLNQNRLRAEIEQRACLLLHFGF